MERIVIDSKIPPRIESPGSRSGAGLAGPAPLYKRGMGCFVIVDAITEIGPRTITGHRQFEGAETYLGIEALAQLGAFHVRYLCDFEKHAFLLGIKRCALFTAKQVSGLFRLNGELLGRGDSAFAYHLRATRDDGAAIDGEFLFATVEYDETHFKRDVLREHYRKVFSCLKNGSSKD